MGAWHDVIDTLGSLVLMMAVLFIIGYSGERAIEWWRHRAARP
jgi:hypothetical protein